MAARVEKVETLIVGAGLMGSALAMHLARLGVSGVRVIDVDLEGVLSSSELNAGGVRATLSQSVNILLSKLSIEYFQTIADEVGYRACGYLWMRSPEAMPGGQRLRERQVGLGWKVEEWDVAQLKRHLPFLDKTDGIAGAHFAPNDGLINPNLLKLHFREEAKRLGVRFDDRTRLVGAEYGSSGVRVRCESFSRLDTDERLFELTDGVSGRKAAAVETVIYEAARVVNSAGAWAPMVARRLGYACPSEPVRRQVCIFDSRDVDLTPYGMIVDPSGVYFHPEATNGLAGVATPEQAGFNFEYDGARFFEELIWPVLYERSSKFERLRHLTGWAGLYEVSPDHSAILGRVEQGDAGRSGRVFEAHSFSGHGVMQCHAAGLGLAELMVKGRYETLDLSVLSGSRFEQGKLISENAVI